MYRLIPDFMAVHVVGFADDALIPKRKKGKEREGNPIRMENRKAKSLENRKNEQKKCCADTHFIKSYNMSIYTWHNRGRNLVELNNLMH